MDPRIDANTTESGLQAARVRVFRAKWTVALRAFGPLAFGFLLLAVAVVMVLIAAQVPSTPERNLTPGLNVEFIGRLFPGIFGGLLVCYGASMLRMTRRVVLSERGVQVDSYLSRRNVPWEEIKSIDRGTGSATFMPESIQVLEILGVGGRVRAVIANTVQGFDELAQELIARSSAAAGQPTYVPEATEARRVKRETRQTRWANWAFLVFTLAMAAGFAGGLYEEIHTRRYASEGVEVEAKVLRTWMVNVTPRVEYSFSDDSGKVFTREAMMYQGPEWELARKSKTIPVLYLKSSPDWNKLASGEDPGPQFGGSFLFLTGGGILMFGLLTVVSMMGYDLKTDKEGTRLMRHGRVVKEWRR